MHRNAIERIVSWNERKKRKPLVLMGARQVGKTWLMNEFARLHYPGDTVYVNLMKMRTLRRQLETVDLSPQAVLDAIRLALDVEIVPGRTLLLLDEIQESSSALTALKFFNEDLPELAVIAAGSLLGLAVGRAREDRQGSEANPNESRGSFPVGKVNFLEVCPMSFAEFVRAVGKRALADGLESGGVSGIEACGIELTDLLKRYLLVGGMPEAVETYAETRDFAAVRDVQQEILAAYDSDFVKHAPLTLLPKIRLLWNSIPAQLAKENKKFVYTALKAGARAREYESALRWLDDAGMLNQVFRVGTPRLPLRSYADFSAFKLYAHDVGLLSAMSELSPSALLEGNALFTNFKGALTEQYVLQELVVREITPFYWTNDAGNAEVEFVVQGERCVLPIEAKAGVNTQAKSLRVYGKLFRPPFSVRTSLAAFHDGDVVKDVPLYAFGTAMPQLLQTIESEDREDDGP